MIPFVVAEAIRRARRRAGVRPARRGGLPMWRLLGGEAAHLVRTDAARILLVVWSGLVSAVGLHLALGPTYPGPVAPAPGRLALSLVVATGAVVLAGRLRDPSSRRGLVSHVAAIVVGAGLVSLVKVGLHDTTPGPVLPGTARWLLVALIVSGIAGVTARAAADSRVSLPGG